MSSAVTYVGHATVLFELGGMRVLTDPLLRTRVGHIQRRVPLPRVEGLAPDAIVVSHAHHDHLDPRSLRRVADGRPIIVPRGCAGILRRRGLKEIIEVGVGDRVAVGGLFIEAVPAVHDGRRYPGGRKREALGYVVEGPCSVYFAGDTDLFPKMEELAGRVDVAALPVWAWGPRTGAGHLDPARAARATALIRPRIAIPIHWGTMAVVWAGHAADPTAPARAFSSAVARLAPDVDVRVLAPGDRADLIRRPGTD
ncbi:MAG TPA: MBL fold metallo-hydrolase [Solirubrobacterales bacterium]|nr:MBL fold metallo-hydrolase [Solirubrobacterales bacterium]